MTIDGYVDYQRREFCKDIKCPIQVKMDEKGEGSKDYEDLRSICKSDCIKTTYNFHHWLIEKEYLIIRKEK